MPNIIKIVTVGKYVGAVRLGKCPMYSVTELKNYNDWKKKFRRNIPRPYN